jgi:hypothetical protein
VIAEEYRLGHDGLVALESDARLTDLLPALAPLPLI